MGTLIIFALSMLGSSLLTAWLMHRQAKGQSPIPSLPSKTEIAQGDENHEQAYTKGRPIL